MKEINLYLDFIIKKVSTALYLVIFYWSINFSLDVLA